MMWKSFFVGLCFGIILSVAAMLLVKHQERYRVITSTDNPVVKLDEWTGKAWLMEDTTFSGVSGFYWVEVYNRP